MASAASAQTTVRFEEFAALLGASCGKDIEANCRGVNLDATRLKECLARNQDVRVGAMPHRCRPRHSTRSRSGSPARGKVAKLCERETAKLCGGEHTRPLACLLGLTKGVSINCSKAIVEAGYR